MILFYATCYDSIASFLSIFSPFLFWWQVSTVDHETVQATALKVVFDLLHLFGLEAFSHKETGQGKDNRGGEKEEGSNGGTEEDDCQDTSTTSTTSTGEEEEEMMSVSAAIDNGVVVCVCVCSMCVCVCVCFICTMLNYLWIEI